MKEFPVVDVVQSAEPTEYVTLEPPGASENITEVYKRSFSFGMILLNISLKVMFN